MNNVDQPITVKQELKQTILKVRKAIHKYF